MLRRNVWLRALVVLLVVAVGLHVAGIAWDVAMRFGDIIMLFLLAWIVAFVLRPVAHALNGRFRLPWAISVAIVYLLFFATVVLFSVVLMPVLVAQIAELAVQVPTWVQGVPDWYSSVQLYLPEQLRVEQLPALLGERDLVAPLQQIVTTLLQNAIGLLTGFATLLFSLVIVVILSFYITLDGERIIRGVLKVIPEQYDTTVYYLVESVERSFGGFLRGQLLQAVIYAAGTALIMWIAGVGYVVLATTIAALAMIVPFIGPFIAIVPPIFLAGLGGSLTTVVFITIALLALQQVVFNVIAPKVMSEAVGIHPLLVFLAILIGSKVAGVAGAIFGVPIAAVITAMLVFLYRRRLPQEEVKTSAAGAPTTTIDTDACTGLRGVWRWICIKVLRRASPKQSGG